MYWGTLSDKITKMVKYLKIRVTSYVMEKFPSWVADNFSAGREIPAPYVEPTASLQFSRDFARPVINQFKPLFFLA